VVARAIVFDVMGTLFDLAPVRRRLSELGAPEGALEAWLGRMLHSAASLTLRGANARFARCGADAHRSARVGHGGRTRAAGLSAILSRSRRSTRACANNR
jgi:phosphoglycolate phosphatase-like HAD superfamily hydrolase